jgi:hypothetical protein
MQVIEFVFGLHRCADGFKFLLKCLQKTISFAIVEYQFVVCKLFQIRTSPDSSILSHKQEGQCNHFGFVQEFFSCLIDDVGIIRPVLETSFIAFHPDMESTVKELGGFKVFAFKTGGFFDHQATR